MKISELIDKLKAYDPDAEVRIVCAIEEDGELASTTKIGFFRAEDDEFVGVSDEDGPDFEHHDYVILTPMEGPWVSNRVKELGDEV